MTTTKSPLAALQVLMKLCDHPRLVANSSMNVAEAERFDLLFEAMV